MFDSGINILRPRKPRRLETYEPVGIFTIISFSAKDTQSKPSRISCLKCWMLTFISLDLAVLCFLGSSFFRLCKAHV